MSSAQPWYAALPAPVAAPLAMSVQELLLSKCGTLGETHIVVDVRRTDIDEGEGRFLLPSAINLPAQTFYQTLPALFHVLGNVPKVIFHCSSSKGRGPRCAGWYQDYLDKRGSHASASYILVGGINAWRDAYPDEIVAL